MLKVSQILVSAITLAAATVALAGCGQKGPLYLPSDPAAAQRTIQPSTLTPTTATSAPAPATSTPAAR